MAEFRLAGGQRFGLTMPTYNIDGGKELETQWMQDHGDRYGEKWGDVNEARIWWIVWGNSKNVMNKSMVGRRWLTGKTITITYTVADGSTKTASFALTGAGRRLLRRRESRSTIET